MIARHSRARLRSEEQHPIITRWSRFRCVDDSAGLSLYRHERAPPSAGDNTTTMTAPQKTFENEAILVAEAQLLLAEKRTSLAAIRTGIALTAIPLSIVSALIATSKLYDASTMAHLLIPVLLACVLLLALGLYLMIRAVIRIHRYDRLLRLLQTKNDRMAELLR